MEDVLMLRHLNTDTACKTTDVETSHHYDRDDGGFWKEKATVCSAARAFGMACSVRYFDHQPGGDVSRQ